MSCCTSDVLRTRSRSGLAAGSVCRGGWPVFAESPASETSASAALLTAATVAASNAMALPQPSANNVTAAWQTRRIAPLRYVLTRKPLALSASRDTKNPLPEQDLGRGKLSLRSDPHASISLGLLKTLL